MTFLFVAITFFWGAGSLLMIAVKTTSIKTVFLKKPSIIIGDFFILPTIAGIIGNYYEQKGFEGLFSNALTWLILVIGFILAITSAIRFGLLHPLWSPHILFYWFMATLILLFLSTLELTSVAWWLVLIGIITHQALGILFPKKFPEIKNEQ